MRGQNGIGSAFRSVGAAGFAVLLMIAAPAAVAQPRQPQVQQPADQVQSAQPGPGAVDLSPLLRRAGEAAGAGRAAEALDALDDAAIQVWERMPLSVRRSVFVAEEPQGYGVFNARDTNAFDPGQPLLVYAELAGHLWRRSGDLFRTDLALDFELRTRDGQSMVAQQNFNTIATASRRRNREFFVYVTYAFTGIEPGDYVVRTIVRDRVGAKQTSFDLAFTIRR